MIQVPSGARVWQAIGSTDMRRGMNGLALQVQQGFGRDPHPGAPYVLRGKRGVSVWCSPRSGVAGTRRFY
jgi:transposase